jgi:hypothetical protein
MSTAQTVVISVEATLFAGAVLAVARDAIKRPWVRFSWSVSFAILPADKREPAPKTSAGTAAGASPSVPADQSKQIRTVA